MAFKVVSVEDDQEIAELLGLVLQSPQIDLFSADSGLDGLTLIREVKPDLVMLDVMIPGMNGWDVYDAIRADDDLKTTPIIMLSVTREGAERRRAFAGSDIDVYITKPFDTLRLRREIGRLLGSEGLWPPPPVRLAHPADGPDMHEALKALPLEESPHDDSPAGAEPSGVKPDSDP